MPQAEARAWWADVEDVRERIERQRAREAARLREADDVGETGRLRAGETSRPLEAGRLGEAGRLRAGETAPGRAAVASGVVALPAWEPRWAQPVPGVRRTVQLRGRATVGSSAPYLREVESQAATAARRLREPAARGGPRRRPRPRPVERIGSSPDRLAAWAFALGVLLLFAAVLSHA
jgi:hypothetical protein